MKRLLTLVLSVMALSWGLYANAKIKKHDLLVSSPVEVGSTQLKPGNYEVAVVDNDLVFYRDGKEVAKAPVKVEELGSKNGQTEMISSSNKLTELHLSGETTKLVLADK